MRTTVSLRQYQWYSSGKEVFSGTILEGKVIGSNLSLVASKATREEITVDRAFTIYCKIQNMLLPYHSTLTEAFSYRNNRAK